MNTNDLYTTAHLFVAAVRVLDHRDGAPPAIASVCRLLDYSDEKGNYLLNRFKEQGLSSTQFYSNPTCGQMQASFQNDGAQILF